MKPTIRIAVAFGQQFDNNSNRKQLTATINGTNDFENDFGYDHLSRLTDLTQKSQGSGDVVAPKYVHFAYNAENQFTSIKRYADTTGTQLVVQGDYGYDNAGRLKTLTYSQGTTFASYGLTYDALNRLKTFTNGQHPEEDVTLFTYDNDGQLIGATRSGMSESYTYDVNGNRWSANGSFYGTPPPGPFRGL